MPIFKRPPRDTLTPAKDRWTPLYLEHGRVEVDDSSVKWIGADATIMRIPVATLSALLLGPGTTVTHAAVKACSYSNLPVCWVGEEGMNFYSYGIKTSHDNNNARKQAKLYSSRSSRTKVARNMFKKRFPHEDVENKKINELRGKEGYRVRKMYTELGIKYGVTWKGRKYDKNNWNLADNINKLISIANAGLYSFCAAVIFSMGFLPQLGFIHVAGSIPFVCDVADMYKHFTSIEAAFQVAANVNNSNKDLVLSRLKELIEANQLARQIPLDLQEVLNV
jgi:CRISPR-associated protein Cas1